MAGWQSAGGTSLFTQFVNEPSSPYVRLIGWSKLMAHDPAVAFDPTVAGLADRATMVVTKGRYSALRPEVIDLMHERSLGHLIITGLDTESCVLATALEAFERDFTPWIVVDAVASHAGPREHEAGLLVAGRSIGRGQLVAADRVLSDVIPRRHLEV